MKQSQKTICKKVNIEQNKFKLFIKDNLVYSAFLILLILYTTSIFAGFVAPYTPYEADRALPFSPPSKIYLKDEHNKFTRPYSYSYKQVFIPEKFQMLYEENKDVKNYLTLFSKGSTYKLFGIFKTNIHLFGTQNGNKIYLLGTDINGQDYFSRVVIGSQISLFIGFIALFISVPLALLYGGISGYGNKKLDNIMMRSAEAIMSIPSFYILIILAGILPSNLTSIQRFILITIILSFIGWASLARIIRGMVLSIKTQEFIQASIAIGQSHLKIILKHILPQTFTFTIIAISISIPSYILSESALSFIGLGIQQPDASWGNLLKDAQDFIVLTSKPWLLTPGFLIFLTVLCFNIISDKIRDIFDTKV